MPAARVLSAVALAGAALAACQPAPVTCDRAAVDVSTAPASSLERRFHDYGDDNTSTGDWTGGDGAYSYALGDGRRVWAFQDTSVGSTTADHGRPTDTPLVSNSLVVQEADGALSHTLLGQDPAGPAPLIPAPSGSWYWPAEAVVEGDELRVLVSLLRRRSDADPLDFVLVGTGVATLSLPGLTLDTSAPPIALHRGGVSYTGLLEAGDFTYVHGEKDRSLYVARAGRGQLRGPWQYRTGTGGWSNDPAAARPVITGGIGHTDTKVVRAGSCFVLMSFEGRPAFFNTPTIRAYVGASPMGPWSAPHPVFTAPEAGPGAIHYASWAHPSLTAGNRLTVGYSVNSLDPAAGYRDVHLYRPRFLEVRLGGLPGTS